MKRIFYLLIPIYFSMHKAYAQHHDDHQTPVEELIVTSPLAAKAADTFMPVNVLSDEHLRENAAATLGETLQNQIGVTSGSFGPGVGIPIIRGHSGNRVRILQNSNGSADVSSISQDHANSVETLLAERIEVIRGPATLLYGNGAIGGVINIIDNRIPEDLPAYTNGAIELRHLTVNQENTMVFKLDGGGERFAWHVDGLSRNSDDTEIPGWAIDEAAVEAAEHQGEAEPHEEDVFDNTFGFIANSDTESQSLTAGLSYIKANGFLGLSINQYENEYGIPPGAHMHDAHEEENGSIEEAMENIRIDMQQTRIDLKGRLYLDRFFEQIDLRISLNDYEHKEIEGGITGTVFGNDGHETRLTFRQRNTDRLNNTISGIIGMHITEREFSAIGEEAFIPVSDIRSMGVFAVESLSRNDWVYELGLRFDRQTVDPNNACKADHDTFSSSIGAIWNFSPHANLLISANRSERSASVEELFSNINASTCAASSDPETLVLHAASARYEIGNPNLNTETANNFELSYRKHTGNVRSEINVYHNRISDYIYLTDTEEAPDGSVISRYQQQDAVFTGLEGKINFPFELSKTQHLDLTIFGDFVNAELDNGVYVPRIPPRRAGIEIAYLQEHWGIKLKATSVSDQTNLAPQEQSTDGYTAVDLHYDYHIDVNGKELILFIKGKNLTDEDIRNHTSFLKNFAPAAGRSFEAGARYYF